MSIFKTKGFNNHFIIAAPRSGTTWMSKMLNTHPDISCVERRLFGNYADFVLDDGQDNPRLRVTFDKYIESLLLHHGLPHNYREKLINSLVKTLIDEERKASNKKVLVDKITPYINTSETVVESINTHFPKSKIIYLVRDGRDVLTSGVFHWFNKKQADRQLNAFEIERRNSFLNSKPFDSNRFFQDWEIEQWAKEWMQPLQTINNVEKKHLTKNIYYEDLLKMPERVLSETFSFLGTKKGSRIIKNCIDSGSFKKMSDGRSQGKAKADAHVRKGVAGDWKNYFTYQDGKLFHEIAGNYLIKFGYVKNEKWFEELR